MVVGEEAEPETVKKHGSGGACRPGNDGSSGLRPRPTPGSAHARAPCGHGRGCRGTAAACSGGVGSAGGGSAAAAAAAGGGDGGEKRRKRNELWHSCASHCPCRGRGRRRPTLPG